MDQHNELLTKFNTLESACRHLLAMQETSLKGEGYPVSGLLLAEDGSVIHADSNGVVQQVEKSGHWQVIDATNHGEQRIIYWYWANKSRLGLPEPQKLTIITTLDPCIMCTASIMLSGFNVGTIALDDYGGANYNRNAFEDFNFAPWIRKQLLQRFGYFRVEDDPQRQKYQYEAENVYFKDGKIPRDLQAKIADKFYASVHNIVQKYFIDSSLPASQLCDLKGLPEDGELVLALRKLDPCSLTIKLTERVTIKGVESSSFEPTQQLKMHLEGLVQSTPHAKNALALVDSFGNLIISRADRFDLSPVHSSIVNTVIDYGKFYFEQSRQSVRKGVPFNESPAYRHLPSLYNCTFIFLNALPGDDLVSLQMMGVYAFSINRNAPPGGIVYINDYEKSAITLEQAIPHLPPQYGSKHMNICPVLANMTRKKIKEELESGQ